jgi:Zn finger protein HypA/HybF involved in hydrogenase expression
MNGILSFSLRGEVSIIKEERMMEIAKHGEKWMCLECWKKLVAKPGEPLPFPTLRMICDECGAQKVLVTNVRADLLSHSSR